MIKFNDSFVDAKLFVQLQDLVNIFSKLPDLEFDFHYGAYFNVSERKVTASHFWDNYKDSIRVPGYKTDVLLRSLGTLHHTSLSEWEQFNQEIQQSNVKTFMEQTFTLLEDLRLEEIIRKERKGTIDWFKVRTDTYTHYFESQLLTNARRNFYLDELFSMIYLTLTSKTPFLSFPKANQEQRDMLERIQPMLTELFEARTTRDIVNICLKLQPMIEDQYTDSINSYFVPPIIHGSSFVYERLFDELLRTDALENDDQEELEDEGETIDETFSTWHRENENKDREQSFLRYELEQGTKTNILGEGARETEEGDQAMASVQGMSAKTDQNQYDSLESLDEKKNEETSEPSYKYGKENLHAIKVDRFPEKPSEEDLMLYQDYLVDIDQPKRRLSQTIEKELERKQNASREHLMFGRLSKKRLLPVMIEDEPRIFYKNDQDSKEIDAAFTLLIDCSASMQNKMEETKKAALLFHEVLKDLKISHSVTGFWEDGFEASDTEQPNYFHRVLGFDDVLVGGNAGASMMQLEPEEDNRDGFSIRVVAEELLLRPEGHKFLLVFSDGEPSAYNYSENGIVDTHEAVLNTRKLGIDVVGVFLSDGEISENEAEMMHNIYGKEHMLVPSISELPDMFSYILKRLLLKTL
ncbi:vWA domain-containing protein [Alkalibacillus aidingensis]|uniref:vWA domain-containing protein n=1 Tax=Alkalibacillus aidingensis TaxID=2747607 RepID=UPI001660E1C4|nr:VWA domain-containing protein [Alkalibacillus aidingensis]